VDDDGDATWVVDINDLFQDATSPTTLEMGNRFGTFIWRR